MKLRQIPRRRVEVRVYFDVVDYFSSSGMLRGNLSSLLLCLVCHHYSGQQHFCVRNVHSYPEIGHVRVLFKHIHDGVLQASR